LLKSQFKSVKNVLGFLIFMGFSRNMFRVLIFLHLIVVSESIRANLAQPMLTQEEVPTTSMVWTLSSSLRGAVEYSQDVKLAQERLRESESQLSLLRSELFPTVNSNLSWLVSKDALKGNPLFNGEFYNRYSMGIELNQPLIRGGLTTGALNAQRKQLAIVELDAQIAERNVSIDVIKAYYQLLLAERKVEIYRKIRSIRRELLKTAESRYRIGREEQLSVLQIRTELAMIEPQVVQSENSRALAAASFANLLGLKTEKELRIEIPKSPLRFRNLNSFQLSKKVKDEVPEIIKNRLMVEQAQHLQRAQMSVHWPKLDAVAGLSRSTFNKSDLFDSDSTQYSYGLRLSVPLFTGLSSTHQRSQLISKIEQARINENKLQDTNQLERVQNKQQMQNAEVVLKATEEALKQAQESVRVASRTYQLGTSNYLQVSQSQTRLAEAEIAFEDAQFQVISQLLEFSKVHGIVIADLLPLFEGSAL
jgi:outer membrane protein